MIKDLYPNEVQSNPNILAAVREIAPMQVDQRADQTIYSENNPGLMPSESYLMQVLDAADLLAIEFKRQSAYTSICGNGRPQLRCLSWLRQQVERLWRRPMNESEFTMFNEIFFTNGTSRIEQMFIMAMGSPQFYLKNYQPKSGIKKTLDYSNYALASRISFFLYNSVPDEELWKAAATGELNDLERVRSHIDRILLHDGYRARFTLYNLAKWLGIDRDIANISLIRNSSGASVFVSDLAQGQLRALDDLVKENRPLSDFFFGGDIYLNQSIASYIQTPSLSTSTTLERVPASKIPPALTSYFASPLFAFKTRSPKGDDVTRLTARGIYVSERFFCQPIAVNEVRPEDVVKVLGPNSASMTQIEIGEIRRQHSSCISCHGNVDKLGMGLEHVNHYGLLRKNYEDHRPITFSFQLGERSESRSVGNFIEFLNELSSDPRVTRCFARTIASKFSALTLGTSQPCVDYTAEINMGAGLRDQIKDLMTAKIFMQLQNKRIHE